MELAIIKRTLSKGGVEVTTAESADEALTMMSANEIDVVLTDYQMPEHDGLWLLQKVRGQYPHVRRLLTSRSTPEGLEAAEKSQLVEHFFRKQITSEQLHEFLRRSEKSQIAPSTSLPYPL